jgi:hypothetical protein
MRQRDPAIFAAFATLRPARRADLPAIALAEAGAFAKAGALAKEGRVSFYIGCRLRLLHERKKLLCAVIVLSRVFSSVTRWIRPSDGPFSLSTPAPPPGCEFNRKQAEIPGNKRKHGAFERALSTWLASAGFILHPSPLSLRPSAVVWGRLNRRK